MQANRNYADIEGRRGSLDRSYLPGAARIAWILEHCNPRSTRGHLPQQLQPFCAEVKVEVCESGSAASGPGEATHESAAHRVRDLDKNDGHRSARPLKGTYVRTPCGQHNFWREGNQFRGITTDAV